MTAEDDDVRRAAAEILRALPDLVGPDSAATLREALSSALRRQDDDASLRVGEILRSNPATREWMRRRLADGTSVDDAVRGFQVLPGHSGPATGELFVCPVCGLPWYRPAVGDAVPPCPVHGVPRVRTAP